MSQPSDLPPDVAGFAQAHRFGRLVAAYRPKRTPILALIGIALFILAPLAGAVAFVVVYGVSAWPGVLLMLAIAAPFIWLLSRSPVFNRTVAARRVYVFEGGLVHADRGLTEYPWPAIMSVQERIIRQYVNGVYTGTQYLYTVRRNDGRVLKLTQFYDGIAQLGQGISEQVARVHLPHALAAIQRGETVPFGDLGVHATGVVSARHGLLPWTELEQVQVVQGYVRLRKAGKWLAWSHKAAADIPNLYVFLTLADQLQRSAHPS
jgi:hypothetical protein